MSSKTFNVKFLIWGSQTLHFGVREADKRLRVCEYPHVHKIGRVVESLVVKAERLARLRLRIGFFIHIF
jgi:hypothetical protein